MPDRHWKRQERAIAAATNGYRLPNTGRSQADVRLPGWAIQVKTRKELPTWLWAAVQQAERDAADGETPAVVLVEVRQGVKAKRLVMLGWSDWLALVAAIAPDAPRAAETAARVMEDDSCQ